MFSVSSRRLASISNQHAKVLILGAGSAGVSVAAQLASFPLFKNKQDITLIDPSPVHSYQPLWTLVGGGMKTLAESQVATKDIIPPGANWIQDAVSKVDPVRNKVTTSSGNEIFYAFLVVATGFKLDFGRIDGLKEVLGKNGVSSNYDVNSVEKTWGNIKNFKGGNAIFTQPSSGIKCAGAPQKIMYLANEQFEKNGVKASPKVEFYTGTPKIFAVDKYAQSLNKICEQRNLNVHLNHELIRVDGAKKQAFFENLKSPDSKPIAVAYELLHVSPLMSPLPFIKESGLADASGFVNVDKHTTQHVKFPNVFSLGDTSSLPTSKTAAAVASQSSVTTANLVSAIQGKPLTESYNGYTSCPLVVDRKNVVLAEFVGPGYGLNPKETFPWDQSQPSRVAGFVNADVLPSVYFNLMLKGKWNGPAKIRPLINPLDSN